MIVTRFAPSPTGHLHIGGASTALFCWAFARRHGGSFILRIEDTDQSRSSDESARGIMEDLAWLGIDWDEGPEFSFQGRRLGGDPRGVGPFFQARRVALYNQHALRLVEMGRAYPAFESAEELDAKRRAAVAERRTYRYDRAALREMPDIGDRLRRMESGEPHVIRFLAPDGEVVVHDEVLGDVRYAAGEMDDFVIRKADGFPTYHFAVVVDDQTMGVTHVLRAQEHLNNTPRHVAMQSALGFHTPAYAHMPLIFNMDGSKMSKREKAKAARAALKESMKKDPGLAVAPLALRLGLDESLLKSFLGGENDSLDAAGAIAHELRVPLPEIDVADFRAAGYLPEAITNFLSLLGWSPGLKTDDGKDLERFDTKFLADNFDIGRIGRTNARFDRVKLASFNGERIASMPDDELVSRLLAWCAEFRPDVSAKLGREQLALLAAALKPRCKVLGDIVSVANFALVDDEALAFDPGAVAKVLAAKEGRPAPLEMLRELRALLADLADFSPAAIDSAIAGFAQTKGLKLGDVAQPLRVAVTGGTVSPPLGVTLAVLGKGAALHRLDRCLSQSAAPR